MKVPMKVDYGVRALVGLVERQSISEPYLDRLLTTLSKFGFIRSLRGPQGGHVLARAPSGINLGIVMAGLEGTAVTLDCIAEPSECALSNICAQREVWRSVEEAVHSVLSSTTIADLANRQKQLQSRGMYQI